MDERTQELILAAAHALSDLKHVQDFLADMNGSEGEELPTITHLRRALIAFAEDK